MILIGIFNDDFKLPTFLKRNVGNFELIKMSMKLLFFLHITLNKTHKTSKTINIQQKVNFKC